jgi:cytochrome P450
MNQDLENIFASFLEPAINEFQVWALQHPDDEQSRALLPILSFVEGIIANEPTYLNQKRLAFGSNFCCAGQVVLGEFATLEAALTSPQSRTWRLGTSVLDANHAPNQDVGGRNVFLLSLSDQAGGDHAAFRQCMQDYILNSAASQRQRDDTARRLLDQLAADYIELPHDQGGAFFTDVQRGWMGFLVHYLHYVLFGLNPDDQDSMHLLSDLHYTRLSAVHYLAGISSLLQTLNLQGHRDLSDLIERAATIYEQSPALVNFQPNDPKYNQMTRRELAKLMTAIMGIAALQGPLHLGYTAMGYRPLPAYKGRQTAEIDVTRHWDELNLDDREAIRLYLLECARLWAPVSATHRIATEPFTAMIAGKERQFPAGTKILIPMSLGLLDEGFWGATTYEFDANRANLCPYHMGFHSVGERHAGRICPGKEVALEMLVDVIRTVGRVRRQFAANTDHA